MNRKKSFVWGVAGLFTVGLVAQPFRPVIVRGGSMSPTYATGEWLWSKPLDRPL